MKNNRVFVFGLDGVLCDHYGDPVEAIRNLTWSLNPHWAEFWILTNREESRRVETANWLSQVGLFPKYLLMRPESFDGPAHEYKLSVLKANLRSGYQILGVAEGNRRTLGALQGWGGVPVLPILDLDGSGEDFREGLSTMAEARTSL